MKVVFIFIGLIFISSVYSIPLLDLNSCTTDDLISLGLSLQEANLIIAYRSVIGAYTSLGQIYDIPGLSKKEKDKIFFTLVDKVKIELPQIKFPPYILSPGDVLKIFTAEESLEVIVQPDYTIYIPTIGTYQVKDLTIDKLREELSKKLGVPVNINFVSSAKGKVYVIGDNDSINCGSYDPGLLSYIIAQAGGLKGRSSKKVYIYRQNGTKFEVNYSLYLKTGDLKYNPVVQAGEAIYIPRRSVWNVVEILEPFSRIFRDITIIYGVIRLTNL